MISACSDSTIMIKKISYYNSTNISGNSSGGSNLSIIDIASNIGNWSGNQSSYSTTSAANLLYAPILATYNNITTMNTTLQSKGSSNLTYTLIMANIGNWSGNQSSYSTKIVADGLYEPKGASYSNVTTLQTLMTNTYNNFTSLNLTKGFAGASAACTYGVANFSVLPNGVPIVTCASAQAGGSRNINYTSLEKTTNNNTIYNNGTVITLYLPASHTYNVKCDLITKSAATTTGFQPRINTTGSPTSVDVTYGPYGSILGYKGTNTASNALAVLTGTVQYAPSILDAYIITSGTNSLFTIEFKAEITASLVSIDRGSWCEATTLL